MKPIFLQSVFVIFIFLSSCNETAYVNSVKSEEYKSMVVTAPTAASTKSSAAVLSMVPHVVAFSPAPCFSRRKRVVYDDDMSFS